MVKTIVKMGFVNNKQVYALFEDNKLIKRSYYKDKLEKLIFENDKIKKCRWCGSDFKPDHLNQKYCCNDCRYWAHVEKSEKYREKFRKLVKDGEIVILKPSDEYLGTAYLKGHRNKNVCFEVNSVLNEMERLGLRK